MSNLDLTTKYNFTVEEAVIFEWQFDMMGGFGKSLMKTISLADVNNRQKLIASFPNHVKAYVGWSEGQIWEQLTMKMDDYPEVFNRFKL